MKHGSEMTREVTPGGKDNRNVGNAGHKMSLRSPSHPWWTGGITLQGKSITS